MIELTAVVAYETDMDGELHVTGACCGDGSIMGKECPHCGGVEHAQPVYGGISYVCEGCEIDVWEPFGTYATDKNGFVNHQQTLEAIRWRGEDGIVHLAWVGEYRLALGCGLSPFPRPVPVDDPYPSCFECIVNDMQRKRFRQP